MTRISGISNFLQQKVVLFQSKPTLLNKNLDSCMQILRESSGNPSTAWKASSWLRGHLLFILILWLILLALFHRTNCHQHKSLVQVDFFFIIFFNVLTNPIIFINCPVFLLSITIIIVNIIRQFRMLTMAEAVDIFRWKATRESS